MPKNKKENAVKSIVKEIKSSGYVEETKIKATKLIEESVRDIESIGIDNAYTDSLENLANYSMNREK